MLSGRYCIRKFFLRDECAQRESRSDGFGNRHNVRGDAETLERKNRSRPPQAALNLVEDKGYTVTVGERATFPQKLRRTFINAALAENWLEHNGAGVVVHGSAEPFQIVLLDERHVFEQRLESLAVLGLARQRQRS